MSDKLTVETRNISIADTGDYDGVVEVLNEKRRQVAVWFGDDDGDEVFAREMVRRWNSFPDLLAMIRRLEWYEANNDSVCPVCGHRYDQGHAPSCELAAMLNAQPKAEGA